MQYCDERVCLSVCLSAHVSQKTQVRFSPNVLYILPVAVARSSSDDSAKSCISGFVDDVTFSHNEAKGPESKMMLCLVEFSRQQHQK